jgi:hypothetical protein
VGHNKNADVLEGNRISETFVSEPLRARSSELLKSSKLIMKSLKQSASDCKAPMNEGSPTYLDRRAR